MELKLRNLTKQYGSFTALNQVNVTFTPGIYGILGTNGAGKSTMMNLISDNLKRSTGEILWNDQEILSLGRKFRKVLGFMPQPLNPGVEMYQQPGPSDSQATSKVILCHPSGKRAVKPCPACIPTPSRSKRGCGSLSDGSGSCNCAILSLSQFITAFLS